MRLSSVLRRPLALAAVAAAVVVPVSLASPASAVTVTAANGADVTITSFNSSGSGGPYPSTVALAGVSGTVTDVRLRLDDLDHTFPSDLDLLLVGPTGANLVVLSDAGGGTDLVDATITLQDGAPPAPGVLVSGATYSPTDTSADAFAAPAPTPSTATTFAAAFAGSDPNGTWSLYITDDSNLDLGRLGSWTLEVTTTSDAARLDGGAVALPAQVTGTSPLPSRIGIAGQTGVVSEVSVTLQGLAHNRASDLDILLQGPTGATVPLMSDLGGNGPLSGSNLTFADGAAALGSTAPGTGTYAPGNIGIDDVPPGTPAATAATLTGAFRGTDPNGTWRLFVLDDTSGSDGTLGGWSISLTVGTAQTVTFTSATPTDARFGQTFPVTAAGGGSGQPVVIASTTPGVCTYADGAVSLVGVGTCRLTADQAAGGDFAAAVTAVSTFVVERAAQTITFTSTPPAVPRIGGTYEVTATGGASGAPVQLGLAAATDACELVGSTVTFLAVGECAVLATQEGDVFYQPADPQTQLLQVRGRAQEVAITSTPPTDLRAGDTYQVTVTGGGSGEPVVLSTGVATTPGTCAVNGTVVAISAPGTCQVVATQAGNAEYDAAPPVEQQFTVARSAPTITGAVTSSKPASAAGWHRTPVLITYTCTPDGVALTGPCPGPVTVTASGRDITTVRTVTAGDGGTATSTVVVDVDRVLPTAGIKGIKAGATYTSVPKVTCKGSDALSGVATCKATAKVARVKGKRIIRFASVVTDRAGNVATLQGTAKLR